MSTVQKWGNSLAVRIPTHLGHHARRSLQVIGKRGIVDVYCLLKSQAFSASAALRAAGGVPGRDAVCCVACGADRLHGH